MWLNKTTAHGAWYYHITMHTAVVIWQIKVLKNFCQFFIELLVFIVNHSTFAALTHLFSEAGPVSAALHRSGGPELFFFADHWKANMQCPKQQARDIIEHLLNGINKQRNSQCGSVYFLCELDNGPPCTVSGLKLSITAVVFYIKICTFWSAIVYICMKMWLCIFKITFMLSVIYLYEL